jgi:chromosome segregation and condensation protein ScpB
MAEPHVISALVKKRGEIVGEIQHLESLIRDYKTNLSSIDTTIHIFDSSYDLRTIKSKKAQRNRYFETGEAKVLILDLLRKASEPIRTDELANFIASNKGLSFDSVGQRSFNKSVINILSTLEKNSLIERVSKEGLTITWQIKAVA